LDGEGVRGFLVAVGKLEDDEEEDDREQVEQKFHVVRAGLADKSRHYAGSKRSAAELMQ
jgi:hypothetical protein